MEVGFLIRALNLFAGHLCLVELQGAGIIKTDERSVNVRCWSMFTVLGGDAHRWRQLFPHLALPFNQYTRGGLMKCFLHTCVVHQTGNYEFGGMCNISATIPYDLCTGLVGSL